MYIGISDILIRCHLFIFTFIILRNWGNQKFFVCSNNKLLHFRLLISRWRMKKISRKKQNVVEFIM